MRIHDELRELAAARPEILRHSEDVVDAAEEDRILRQILTTVPLGHGRTGAGHDRARRRLAGRLGGLGLATAAVVSGFMVIASVTASPGSSPAIGLHGAGRSARQMLLTAAVAAARAPAWSGAYWYVKTTTVLPHYRETDESWTRRDGTTWVRAGRKTAGRVMRFPHLDTVWQLSGDPGALLQLQGKGPLTVGVAPPHPDRLPSDQVTFGQLQRLPTNPAALKALIISIQPSSGLPDPEHVGVFLALTNLVAGMPAPPQVRAAAFRALATLPGVTSTGPVPGGQGLRLWLGGHQAATLTVDPATSQASDVLRVVGVGGTVNSLSVTAHWTDQRS
ncbi:MAG TPA: hypothetical protein VGS19_33895 [Streptosporangiaceae bacterium]|nr:hypothetical protein [Streptosporangiaceae bacterium]